MPSNTVDGVQGLTSDEARRRLAQYGPNRIAADRHRRGIRWFIRPLADPMVLLLLVASVTYFALGDYADTIIIAIAIIPIMLVTLVLEVRAERALEKLRALASPTSTVIRDGVEQVIPAEQLVPGDLYCLREGDVIPADGVLREGSNVAVDESSLTGESQPVTKDASASDERNIFAGTTVLAGRGIAELTATGSATQYGRIGTLLATIETPPTPLQRLIQRLVRQLALAALLVCLLVAVLELLAGHGWSAAIIAAVSLGIAAVPEEFPMVYTLYLSLGAWRLARDHALVRRLVGVETLGSTTVICTDKTGTLTLGTVEVGALGPLGEAILPADQPLTEAARTLLEAALRASEPNPYDPLEQAIERFAAAHGIDIATIHRGQLIQDYPFDPTLKYVTHVWHEATGYQCAAKGALEGLVSATGCNATDLTSLQETNRQLAMIGMRVIAVAAGRPPTVSGDRERDEQSLHILGLLAFSDPRRPGVRAALRTCREAGIRVILITGDHPETAHAVAEDLELPHQDIQIATGADIDTADDRDLLALVRGVNIFARTRPEQKHRLVMALRSIGEVVAMTGDGTNDAPALREADIGVAMGQRGTEVARSAAQLILLDDNFATIVKAVRDGRRIFANLRRAFVYLIAFHIPLVLIALIAPLAGLPLLLLPVHLIWLELIVHPTASLVFEADEGRSDLMQRPPQRRQSLITKADLTRAVLSGLVLTGSVLGLYVVQIGRDLSTADSRSSALVALIIGQMSLVLIEAAHPDPVSRRIFRIHTLIPVIATVLATLAVGLYLPAAADLLKLTPLNLTALVSAIIVGLVATWWRQPLELYRSRRQA